MGTKFYYNVNHMRLLTATKVCMQYTNQFKKASIPSLFPPIVQMGKTKEAQNVSVNHKYPVFISNGAD